MIRGVLFGLYETLVRRYSPPDLPDERIGAYQILSLDIETVREHFAKTQKARYEGEAWTRRRIISQLAVTHGVRLDRNLLSEYERQLHERKKCVSHSRS